MTLLRSMRATQWNPKPDHIRTAAIYEYIRVVRQAEPGIAGSRRALFHSSRSRDDFKSRKCLWCSEEVEKRQGRWWHPTCVEIYQIAKGKTMAFGKPLIVDGICENCESAPGKDIDHRIALGIVARMGDRRLMRDAFWYGNLQWLCGECHRLKTIQDKRAMAVLDKGESMLLAGPDSTRTLIYEYLERLRRGEKITSEWEIW